MIEGRPIRVLFLCTGNSCRSQMAEALLGHLGGERFEALSAGSHPAGFIHPLAVDALRPMDVPLTGQTSKSWDSLIGTPVDAVVTLCDAAAAEICPVFPGSPISVHWSLPDPVYHAGTDEERLAFARSVAERLGAKIAGLVQLDWSADRAEIRKRLEFLGEI
jgi:arsenate reductase